MKPLSCSMGSKDFVWHMGLGNWCLLSQVLPPPPNKSVTGRWGTPPSISLMGRRIPLQPICEAAAVLPEAAVALPLPVQCLRGGTDAPNYPRCPSPKLQAQLVRGCAGALRGSHTPHMRRHCIWVRQCKILLLFYLNGWQTQLEEAKSVTQAPEMIFPSSNRYNCLMNTVATSDLFYVHRESYPSGKKYPCSASTSQQGELESCLVGAVILPLPSTMLLMRNEL